MKKREKKRKKAIGRQFVHRLCVYVSSCTRKGSASAGIVKEKRSDVRLWGQDLTEDIKRRKERLGDEAKETEDLGTKSFGEEH